jgi:hypothetical protein
MTLPQLDDCTHGAFPDFAPGSTRSYSRNRAQRNVGVNLDLPARNPTEYGDSSPFAYPRTIDFSTTSRKCDATAAVQR